MILNLKERFLKTTLRSVCWQFCFWYGGGFPINIKKFAIIGDKNKKNMNVWWQKIFDLFVVGGYLALDFMDNFRIKGFS
ncbi:hypothetical protein BD0036_08620 [Helicobacter pylori]